MQKKPQYAPTLISIYITHPDPGHDIIKENKSQRG